MSCSAAPFSIDDLFSGPACGEVCARELSRHSGWVGAGKWRRVAAPRAPCYLRLQGGSDAEIVAQRSHVPNHGDRSMPGPKPVARRTEETVAELAIATRAFPQQGSDAHGAFDKTKATAQGTSKAGAEVYSTFASGAVDFHLSIKPRHNGFYGFSRL